MKLTGIGVSQLAALDCGGFREALARYESSSPTDDTVETIWRAEMALYLERLDDARGEVERVESTLDRDLANRVQTIRAEIAFWDRALDEARELIGPVIQSTWEAGDMQGHLRATLLRARVELRRGNHAEALERMKEPRRLATVLGNDYYAGVIAHCRAFAYYFLGDFKQAGHAFAEALHLLHASEGLRWELSCRTLYAAYLADVGRYDEALAECDRCERNALELGLVNDALNARNNAAATLYLLGRYEEVVGRLEDLLNWERVTRHVYAETTGLVSLAMALGELERFDDAERAASEAIQLARLANNGYAELDAQVLAAWAAGRAGKSWADEAIQKLVATADLGDAELQKCEARLYAADVMRATKPDVAVRYCREARAFDALEENARLQRLADRIERSLSEGAIRIGLKGELIFDLSAGWPDFDEAVEIVKRYLVVEAVRQSKGNRSEAARKLNLTRSRLHDLWRQIHGEPPRPARSSSGAGGRSSAALSGQNDVETVDHDAHLI